MAQIRIYATNVELTFTETSSSEGRVTAAQAGITYTVKTGRITATNAALNYQPVAVVTGAKVASGLVGGSVVQSSVAGYVAPSAIAGTRRLT